MTNVYPEKYYMINDNDLEILFEKIDKKLNEFRYKDSFTGIEASMKDTFKSFLYKKVVDKIES